uniref:Uncharacterized protein n=1 Tax=Arundo donax TaxID=35708 RepID=A0A0A8Z617_ARUDO
MIVRTELYDLFPLVCYVCKHQVAFDMYYCRMSFPNGFAILCSGKTGPELIQFLHCPISFKIPVAAHASFFFGNGELLRRLSVRDWG